MKVLVLGDLIVDTYRMCTATRLCPEAPVPVVVEKEHQVFSTSGGAGLVADQLKALAGEDNVTFIPGSISNKERIFADDHLLLRIDDDSKDLAGWKTYQANIEPHLAMRIYDAVVVSDYGKGGCPKDWCDWLMKSAEFFNLPVFVDAKNNSHWYNGSFAAFPNEKEIAHLGLIKHIVRKLGPRGCEVDGVHIPTNSHPVRDVTGAGDCFIAAFVYNYLVGKQVLPTLDEKAALEHAARYANKVAGISVEFVGTHVVTKEEIDARN